MSSENSLSSFDVDTTTSQLEQELEDIFTGGARRRRKSSRKGSKKKSRRKSVTKISNIRDNYLLDLLSMRKKYEKKS